MSNELVNPCLALGCQGNCCRGNLVIDVESSVVDLFLNELRRNGRGNMVTTRPSFKPDIFTVTIIGDCPLLSDNYSCTIYDERPIGCKAFEFNGKDCRNRRCLIGF